MLIQFFLNINSLNLINNSERATYASFGFEWAYRRRVYDVVFNEAWFVKIILRLILNFLKINIARVKSN